jgi:two-component system nitrate/nitrite response regulator NarL
LERLWLNVPFDLVQNQVFKKDKAPLLTPREKEVLQLIAEGYTNPQIASKLYVSVLTVNSHRKNLLSKFEVNNTASLIREAAKMGLI